MESPAASSALADPAERTRPRRPSSCCHAMPAMQGTTIYILEAIIKEL